MDSFTFRILDVIVDMVESLIPCSLPPYAPFYRYDISAISAPISSVATSTDTPTRSELRLFVFRDDLVILPQVFSEDFGIPKDLSALAVGCWVFASMHLTAPHFLLEMLGVLMAFPVILGAEDLRAEWKGTAIRLSVPLFVLPIPSLVFMATVRSVANILEVACAGNKLVACLTSQASAGRITGCTAYTTTRT